MRLTRRATLLAAIATAGAARAQDPADVWDPTGPKPPPPGADAYGLNPFFKSKPYIENALRKLDEPALLLPETKIAAPIFRLTETRRLPRSARIIFNQDGGASVVLKRYPWASTLSVLSGGKPLSQAMLDSLMSGVLSLDPERGLRLRLLVDDQDRFWNGACDPPNWEEITANAQNAVYVTSDGWSVALERRVGPKRHAILRSAPDAESWLGKISASVFGSREPG